MKTIVIIIGIFLISGISALDLNVGEPYTIDLGETYSFYSFVGNNTPVDIEIENNGSLITITPNKYSESDNFEIIFFNKEKEIINHYSGGGGGGTRTIYRDRNVTTYLDNEFEAQIFNMSGGGGSIVTFDEPIQDYLNLKKIIIGIMTLLLILMFWAKISNKETPESETIGSLINPPSLYKE